jgi:sulfur transfer complex TusBCD TusB component (DsrH family)
MPGRQVVILLKARGETVAKENNLNGSMTIRIDRLVVVLHCDLKARGETAARENNTIRRLLKARGETMAKENNGRVTIRMDRLVIVLLRDLKARGETVMRENTTIRRLVVVLHRDLEARGETVAIPMPEEICGCRRRLMAQLEGNQWPSLQQSYGQSHHGHGPKDNQRHRTLPST